MHRAGQSWVFDCDALDVRTVGATPDHARYLMRNAIRFCVERVAWVAPEKRIEALFAT